MVASTGPNDVSVGPFTTTNASEPLSIWAALRTPDGQRITLPPQHGPRVRLPGGSYEVWAKGPLGWMWQRLELTSGQSHALRFEGPAQRLRRAEAATVHPAGWPAVALNSGWAANSSGRLRFSTISFLCALT